MMEKNSQMVFKNIKIAHFISDQKFPDSAYKQFEQVLPGCNDFFIPSKPKKLQYIKQIPVKFVNSYSFMNPFFIKKLSRYDFIVLHALYPFNQKLVAHSPRSMKLVWIGMGFDYYDLICDNEKDLYLEKTRGIANQFRPKKTLMTKKALMTYLKYPFKPIVYNRMSKIDLMNRIDFFSPVLEIEHELIKKKLNQKIPPYIHWNYAAMSKYFDSNSNIFNVEDDNILLGNSATLTNNHIEAIDFLKEIIKKNQSIICPLSYGDKSYGDYVEEYGKNSLGRQFIAIRRFMSFDNYMKLIANCSYVVMNHLRQQAAGNIAPMLRMGAKIFLNEKNPLFSWYRKLGVKIFSLSDLQSEPSLLASRLCSSDLNKTRKILKDIQSWDTAIKKTENLIETVINLDKK